MRFVVKFERFEPHHRVQCHPERSEPASEVEGSAAPAPNTRSWIDPSSCLLRMTLASDRAWNLRTLYSVPSEVVVFAERQDLGPVGGDRHGVLEVGAQAAVDRHGGPAVLEHPHRG